MNREKINKLNAERLSKVKPILREKCEKIISLAKAENYILLVTNGFRSIEEQNKLYNQPHDKIDNDGDGRIDERDEKVTNAKGGQSNHNFRDAVDFAFIVDGEISWDEKLYKNIGRWAKIVGLKWGGNWKSFKDLPHVEL